MRLKSFILAGAAFAALLPASAHAQSFTEVLTATYQTNPRLKAERARVREADEAWVQARAVGRLSASTNLSVAPTIVRTPAQGFLGAPAEGTDTDSIVPRQAGLNIIQPIYQGGRVRHAKAQAKAGVFAARETLRQVEQSTLLSAATAYADVRRDESTTRIRRNNISVLLRQQEASTVRFEVGEGTRTDIAQADTRLAQSRIALAQADAQLAASKASFERAVGFPPEQLAPVPEFRLPPTLADAIRIARGANPQLMAAYFNQQAADAGVDVAKSAGRPSVSLQGQVGVLREQLNALSRAESASLTANLTVPIFSGGLNRSRVRQAKHARTRAGFEARDLERAVIQTVSQGWAQIEAAGETVAQANLQVDAAEIAFEGVELEQQVGTRTALDVLDAEQELLNARLNVTDAQRQLDISVFQLLAVLGAFDADALQLDVDAYDPRRHFEAAKYEGMDEFVDTYVPVAARKIGSQLDDAVETFGGVVVDGLDAVEVLDAAEGVAEGLGEFAGGTALMLKEGVDAVTFQNREALQRRELIGPLSAPEAGPRTVPDNFRTVPDIKE